MRAYDNILKIAASQGDDYTTGCFLDYNYCNEHYKMIAMDLSKQQALDADPKAIPQVFLEIYNNKPQYPSLLKKQKKPY